MAGSVSHDELLDSALSLEAIIWRLFHEEPEIRVSSGADLARGCRCTLEHYATVIARFPEDEQKAMCDDKGIIAIDCAFCSRLFELQI
jgi:molecular chaperone Hsp33